MFEANDGLHISAAEIQEMVYVRAFGLGVSIKEWVF